MGFINDYEPAVYNRLGQIDEVDKLVNNEQICGLGKIILKYGYGSELVVIKAHRHFNLDATEAMLELADGNNGSTVARPVPLAEIVQMGATPNVIAFNGDTQRWLPVNYALIEKKEVSAWKDDAFLDKVADYLKANQLVDKLMLGAARLRDADVQFVELNYHETRTSKVHAVVDGFVKPEGPSFETTYCFDWGSMAPDGERGTGNACIVQCIMHCKNTCFIRTCFGKAHG